MALANSPVKPRESEVLGKMMKKTNHRNAALLLAKERHADV